MVLARPSFNFKWPKVSFYLKKKKHCQRISRQCFWNHLYVSMYLKNNSFCFVIMSLNYHHKTVIPNMIFQSFDSKLTFVTNLVTISLSQVAKGEVNWLPEAIIFASVS